MPAHEPPARNDPADPRETPPPVARARGGTPPPGKDVLRSQPPPPSQERESSGLDRVRDILLGDVVTELDRRLSRVDAHVSSRTQELQQDARLRTDVLERHVRKQFDAHSNRLGREIADIGEGLRATKATQRDALAQIEQRMTRLEERVEGGLTRVERELREQMLEQAKGFLDELERLRAQVRSTLEYELGIASETVTSSEEASESAAAPWTASH